MQITHIKRLLFLLAFSAAVLCACVPVTDREPGSRQYSPDRTKYLLRYRNRFGGAWDGGRDYFVTIMNATDTIADEQGKLVFSSLEFDSIYWRGNDTVIIEDKFSEYMSTGKMVLKPAKLKGITIKIVHRDPIDTSYTRKIFYRETSPDQQHELIVYKHIKPGVRDLLLNISVINKGDSIPKYGNFYISRYNFDCFNDIRWDTSGVLDCKVSGACYYSFKEYLVWNRPAIRYKVTENDTIHGNIRPYME